MKTSKINRVHISSIQDFQDRKGKWVDTFSIKIDGIIYQYTTRAGKLYGAVKKRTRLLGCIQNETKRYERSWNLFNDFQAFAGWCQDQIGYWNREESGNFWSIDKDILVPGNKNYSPETCCFVPAKINTLLNSRVLSRGDYPVGVHYEKARGKYVAQSASKQLGRFDTVKEAHAAWQQYKISAILEASKNTLIGNNVKLALVCWADKIGEDLKIGIETVLI